MPKEMQNRRLSSSSPDYTYFAIVRKDAKSDPERVPLQKNLDASKSQFKELLRKGEKQKYEIGIMAHSAKKSFGFKFPTNLPKVERSKNEMASDIDEMLGTYAQKVAKVFLKQTNNEKEAGLMTLAEATAVAQAKLKKVRDVYKGKGESLHRAYRFSMYYQDASSKATGHVTW
jgi:hypothetical protein